MKTQRRTLLLLGAASLAAPAFTWPGLLGPAAAQPSTALAPGTQAPIDLGTGKPPYRLDVAVVETIDRYEPPFRPPNVEHQFAEPPARLAARWATQRLVAVGTQRTARFTITEASVVEVQLPKTGGIRGVFTTDQDRRYDGKLAVSLEIRSFGGALEARADATAMASKALSEKATLDDRDTLFQDLDRELIRLVEIELDKGIRTYLEKWVR